MQKKKSQKKNFMVAIEVKKLKSNYWLTSQNFHK
jgi:hypothetical protein